MPEIESRLDSDQAITDGRMPGSSISTLSFVLDRVMTRLYTDGAARCARRVLEPGNASMSARWPDASSGHWEWVMIDGGWGWRRHRTWGRSSCVSTAT
jgi:hypothetical protein